MCVCIPEVLSLHFHCVWVCGCVCVNTTGVGAFAAVLATHCYVCPVVSYHIMQFLLTIHRLQVS